MSNPALGGGSQLKTEKLRSLTDMLATLVDGGEATFSELRQFATEVEALAASNQSPTRAQWEALEARDRTARDAIAANRRAIEERAARENLRLVEESEAAPLKTEDEKSLNPGGDPPNSADQ